MEKKIKVMKEVEGIFPIVCFLTILTFLNMIAGGEIVLSAPITTLVGLGMIGCMIGMFVSMVIYLLHFAAGIKENREEKKSTIT